MKHLIHSYSLQAFPTEKVLKEFTPVRGLRFLCPVNLKPGENAALDEAGLNRLLDPKSWFGLRVVPDVTPIFKLIADRFGYELPLLLEGKGETGKTADSWTVYADEGKAPMLVRWTIGEAQFLLTIAMDTWNPEELQILILADGKACKQLDAVGETLRQVELPPPPRRETRVSAGNLLQRVTEVADSGDSRFTVRCVMHVDPTQPLNPAHQEILRELRNSARIIVVEGGGNTSRPFGLDVGETEIDLRKDRCSCMCYRADEKPSWEFLCLAHQCSVADITKEMVKIFDSHFEERRQLKEGVATDSLRREDKPGIDIELAERRAQLDLVIGELRSNATMFSFEGRLQGLIQEAFNRRVPSLGSDFVACPETELRGTGPDLQMKSGHVAHNSDLLYQLLTAFCKVPEHYPASGHRKPQVMIGAKLEAPIMAEQYRESHPPCVRFTEITNPFLAVHHGLPVRVDKSVAVWRRGFDQEALAADFFYAPETKDLHVANLYRIKVPKD